jgi:hypothetical protein
MSCRTTPAGRLSVSFLKHNYGFTESQCMSLYHGILRRYRTSSTPTEDVEAAYERGTSELASSIDSLNIPPSKKESLKQKLSDMTHSASDPDHMFAISQLIRTGDTANAMIQTTLTLAHARQNNRMSFSETKENYLSLLEEYKNNKDYIESHLDLFPMQDLIDGYPQDKATTYAINAINNARRCIHCGRFVGLTTIHTCPQLSETVEAQAPSYASPFARYEGGLPSYAAVPNLPAATPHSQNEANLNIDRKASYSEPIYPMSMEEFQERYDAAKLRIQTGAPVPEIPFTEDGFVTAGISRRNGGNTFGIELEVDFPFESPDEDEEEYYEDSELTFYSRHNLAQELYRQGVTISPDIQRWHFVGENERPGGEYTDAVNGWICEFDRSVDPYQGARGVEIKSQILYDEKATWENIQKIAESLKRHNAKATQRTGMHINIGGAEFSNTNPTAHNSLLKLAAAYDDVLIRLAHNPQSGKQHRGRGYCSTAYLPPEGYGSISSARAHSNHYQAFNLGHLPSEGEPHRKSSRVEVRFWDGATDFGRIQTAVAISAALVELALRNQEPHNDPQASGYHARRFGIQRMEGETWEESTLSFRKFLSLMEVAGLKTEAHKNAFFHLFAESRWTRA